ncbi:MAG: UDP-4-amino-4,6-dideoxy-N-acetyl-beta-L-altrosamine transaminase [Sulfurimonas sp.]|nr:UDP-4-amino-4,6-dideoxy-N-acetyl-beta-L-altrosamine transaminase [Sulfurimonas sp.]MBU3938344.1 UDP-4-amino-4,6-dideoxy-N-acetyl-beta-L-altrosamine transaminase [bacterium]MBU4025146.1 UDP-4-amino-4,6-dideoxy-N-acetyl-beta-L-altrosamine transaminase [bacterium]MBU4057930.1 UDP-4-amino-4,6-dideoxy-N-acetyl-beta-L-altrosamine transaminase [bacterium]MBU4109374.1 UDP-4-amino-4,6-dideoxy-N-acetyl-beta-L-altrosamine transaminase [bacterium]
MIPYSRQSINAEDIDEVLRVLQSSHLTQGKEVELFEDAICDYIGCSYAVTFNSATSALLAAYSVTEISEGDEIITSPISFVATSNMFVNLGAKPLWCDVKLDGNIDETRIEKLITPKTKAIVPIDFAGKPVNINAINAVATKHNLLVIQDSSHAFGSTINDKKIGTFADMTIFSFHAIKPITTGEGGCVVTDNEEFAKKLKLFRSHGMVKKELWNSDMISLGHNFRLTEFAAALGRSQLGRIDDFIDKRNAIARYYDERFAGHKLFSTITLEENSRSSRHLYPILLHPFLHCNKEEIFKELQAKGLGVQVHYKPIYQNSFYKEKFGELRLEVSEDFYRCELSLPCHQEMSLEDAQFVAETFLEVLENYKHRGCSF